MGVVVAAGFDVGVSNVQGLLLKLAGVAIIVVGAGVIWAAKKSKFGEVVGTVGIVLVGVSLIALGVGFAVGGTQIGRAVWSFFGFGV
jgi:hypothetical protein